MTVRSKSTFSAEIVEIDNLRHTPSRHRIVRATGRMRRRGNHPEDGAKLLSIRQHLHCKATVAINDLSFIESRYSPQVANRIMHLVRSHLNDEFGQLRVHRHRQIFVVGHHCMESLIAGLLRVQFHSKQIALPVTQSHGELSDICGIPLSWGVGNSLTEAENERIRRLKGIGK